MGFTPEDPPENVEWNRRELVASVTGGKNKGFELITVRQIHSGRTVTVDQVRSPGLPEADGLISETPGLLLGILTADCIPVLIADRRRRVIGAFHAGWRGTAARIVEQGIRQMHEEFGCECGDLVAAIGAGIGVCCYAVGEELKSAFTREFRYGESLFRVEESLKLDLREANRQQLLDAGVPEDTIDMVGECTACHIDTYFSHRAEKGRTGRMLSVIGVAASA